MKIYQPNGKAREYSPLAYNLYRGCNHGCDYCYVPAVIKLKKETFHSEISCKEDIRKIVSKEFNKIKNSKEQVFFSFSTDPYNKLEEKEELTKFAIEQAYQNSVPISILTKSSLVLRDMDLFKKFGNSIKVGMTLTFSKEETSKQIEPEASLPNERIEVLKTLKRNGIKTWASIEPVIIPEQSLEIIKRTLPYVDNYKVGMVSNYKGIHKQIDWNLFISKVIPMLREAGKEIYVKTELRSIVDFKFNENETLMDLYVAKPFNISLF